MRTRWLALAGVAVAALLVAPDTARSFGQDLAPLAPTAQRRVLTEASTVSTSNGRRLTRGFLCGLSATRIFSCRRTSWLRCTGRETQHLPRYLGMMCL